MLYGKRLSIFVLFFTICPFWAFSDCLKVNFHQNHNCQILSIFTKTVHQYFSAMQLTFSVLQNGKKITRMKQICEAENPQNVKVCCWQNGTATGMVSLNCRVSFVCNNFKALNAKAYFNKAFETTKMTRPKGKNSFEKSGCTINKNLVSCLFSTPTQTAVVRKKAQQGMNTFLGACSFTPSTNLEPKCTPSSRKFKASEFCLKQMKDQEED